MKKIKKLEFTQELWDKIYTYALMNAREKMGTSEGNCEYLAEEATATILSRFYRNPLTPEKMNDNYYFISAKNAVTCVIRRELESKKSSILHDYNNISLDEPLEGGVTLEFEYEDTIPEKLKEEKFINDRMNLLVNTLENSEYLSDLDTTVFVERYMNNKSIKEISKSIGVHSSTLYKSSRRVRNVLNHLKNNLDENKKNTK